MSWDFILEDPNTGETIKYDQPMPFFGGTYQVGGTTTAEFNITYNYSKHYRRVMGGGGISDIYGMTGRDSIPVLSVAIAKLGDDRDLDDYWNPTEGNAKAALKTLLFMAALSPDGVWKVL